MNSRIKQISALLILYVVLPLGFTTLYFIGSLYSLHALFEPYNLSMIAGALAYMTFMTQFVLSSRIRFIERLIPQDRLLALHGAMGIATAALVLSHFLLKFFLVLRFGTPTLQSALGFLALIIYAVLAPAALLVLRGRGRKKGGSPPYEKARKGHNLFALAGLLAVVHVFLASSTWTPALKIITLVWGVFALGSYVIHKMVRPRRAADLKLVEITSQASEVYTFRFESAGSRMPGPRRSGQFGYFSFESDISGSESHPFTVASPGSSDVEIVVRSSGDFTSAIKDVPTGTVVRFDGPYGHFTPGNLAPGTPLVFLAGGIGITPFLSMIRDTELRSKYKINLVWSIRGPEDIEVIRSIQTLADSGEISMQVIYTRNAPEGEPTSRLNKTRLADMMQRLPESQKPVWFICGPPEFSNSMRKALKELKVSNKHIRSERFSW
jgi:predicted ferric reductase